MARKTDKMAKELVRHIGDDGENKNFVIRGLLL